MAGLFSKNSYISLDLDPGEFADHESKVRLAHS